MLGRTILSSLFPVDWLFEIESAPFSILNLVCSLWFFSVESELTLFFLGAVNFFKKWMGW